MLVLSILLGREFLEGCDSIIHFCIILFNICLMNDFAISIFFPSRLESNIKVKVISALTWRFCNLVSKTRKKCCEIRITKQIWTLSPNCIHEAQRLYQTRISLWWKGKLSKQASGRMTNHLKSFLKAGRIQSRNLFVLI